MRYFNTAGPCDPGQHYMVPPIERLPGARELVERGMYFVVHAPRQTGKTTTLRALAKELTAAGRFAALHFSCETGQAAEDDFGAAERMAYESICEAARSQLPPELQPPPRSETPAGTLLSRALADWARQCPRPLALVFDEIDALRGNSLISVLRQLRAGYPSRPSAFPASVILCGLRDVRDYKAASGGDPSRLGTASPFNIKVKSYKMANFTREQVAELYGQHARETGQAFEARAVERAVELTGGQPWLVNALAREIVEEMAVPAGEPVTAEHVEEAKERLILARATHLDSLVARLMEPRVKRLMEPVLAGALVTDADAYVEDVLYLRDLGLLADDNPVRVANPIYREVIVRVLSAAAEGQVLVEPRTFVMADGRLDMRRLMAEFLEFWKENGEVLAAGLSYHEAAPQLVLMAFLQRVVNSGGYVEREYGVGRGRIDLLLKWPYAGPDGKREWQREALELKVWAEKRPDPLAAGLKQLDAYLDRLSLPTGILVLFDRRAAARPVEERCGFEDAKSPAGRTVLVMRA